MMEIKAISGEKKTSGKPAIVVKNVTKEFIIPHERKTTLFENLRGSLQPSTYEKFTALDDVSFTVERGESVGIIGDNGSGKSTLLKIISKILRPTGGSIEVNGRITPFLELGVGFSQDLTARENIEVYSTIMGLSDEEIGKNMGSVLEFAGLTKFADTKLKNFSSGMQVRLAFATAIQRKPEILLIDEVLAVGDMEFQQKCLDIFNDYIRSGVTMLLVSHDLNTVRRFCNKTLLLNQGKMLAFGKTGDVIDRYVYRVDRSDEQEKAESSCDIAATALNLEKNEESCVQEPRVGNQKIVIKDVKILDKFGNESSIFNSQDPLRILISYDVRQVVSDLIFGIAVYDEAGNLCYGTNTDIQGLSLKQTIGRSTIEIAFPSLGLIAGNFKVTLAAHSRNNVHYDWLDKKFSFTVINSGNIAGVFDLKGQWK